MRDIIVVGGGIVGVATAFQLKKKNPSLRIAILEKESELAAHQTGHNSGVIHSGIYYKPGSLKAKNCIEGYRMLLDFCDQYHIEYNLCGKIIVATEPHELPALENVYQRGIANGLTAISFIGAEQIREIEPHVRGIKGIKVPYTGIIDYVQVARTMSEQFQVLGGEVMLSTKVLGIQALSHGSVIQTNTGDFEAKLVINCAGLYSDKVASFTVPKLHLRIIPFRGEYYLLKPEKQYLVKSLVYPVPDPNFPFLGVHFTNMIGGGVEAGPNAVFAFKREGYHRLDFDAKELYDSLSWPGFQKVALKYWKTGLGEYHRSFSKRAFTKALQRLVPDIQMDDLVPTHAGVRAQACDREGGLLDDFAIIQDLGAIHVCNAPSPAATSSLSIGHTVSDMALARFYS